MKRLILFINSVCFCYASLEYSEKIWTNYTPNPSFDDWNDRLSINGIHFPMNLSNPVAFPSDENNFCQIIIPTTIDGDHMNKDISENDDQSAELRTVNSACLKVDEIKMNGAYWVDPRNWRSEKTNEATPHIERLPCWFDSVTFSNLSGLFVIFPNKNVTVKRIKYNFTYVYKYNFKYESEIFLKHFVVSEKSDILQLLKLNGSQCTDIHGCECGTFDLYLEACSRIKDECSTKLTCPFPVQPVGHCCPICGGYIKAYYDSKIFTYGKFTRVVEKFLKNTVLNLKTHISKIQGNVVHIVILDENRNEDDVYNITVTLRDLLTSSSMSILGILEVEWYASGSLQNPLLWKTTVRVMLPTFGVALMFIIVFFIYNSQKMKFEWIFKRPVSFVKFKNKSENVQFGLNGKENSNSSMNVINNEAKLQNSQMEKEDKSKPEVVSNLIET